MKKRFIIVGLVCVLAAILIIKIFTSFDILAKVNQQIRVKNHLQSFKLTEAKIDYHVAIRKSSKPYDYVSITGSVPSFVKNEFEQLRPNSSILSLNLYTSKNLIYAGSKATQITLYVRDQSVLKEVALNGKRLSTTKKAFDMPSVGDRE
ncbi:hypothetical protein NIE88_11995 [Sporolactobacillus shoreicorticis]|uniref:Uncharacterized protein n=1 Tax=Sporolactobacillus shoreicorticis TaxID=1923877 RepID=A0ABW5S1J4_9BACL|nr:hypothetical protein [Sporolactobacillus shoreicorticis]MCO7126488.1 hypothetical protein [Sporolactobacillus shoreicorticis]